MKFKLNSSIIVVVLVACVIATICFYSEWSGVKEENSHLIELKHKLEQKYKTLQNEEEIKREYYNRLISDPKFAERVIKESLGYAEPNDIVIRFKDSEPADINSSSKKVEPELRVDMTNASDVANGNNKNSASENIATQQPPENVQLVSDASQKSLQNIQMRAVKIKLGGTNNSIKTAVSSSLKPVRFITR